jgi:UDP:flavonoid glycosyltransferase YjiC (YdhE family)
MLAKPAAPGPESAVVFGSPVAVGHVRPLMPLARRLVERGFLVVWAVSGDANEPASKWREPLSALGVRFVDLDETVPFVRGGTPEFSVFQNVFARIAARANDISAGAADAIALALEGRRPVAAVYDYFALWFHAATRRLGVDNVVSIVSAFPTPESSLPKFLTVDNPLYDREMAALRQSGWVSFGDAPRLGIIPDDPALRVACFSSPRLCPEPPGGILMLGVAREALPHVGDLASAPEEHRALVRRLADARERGAKVLLLSMGTVVTRMFTRMGPEHIGFLKRLYTTLAASALRSGAVVVASTCDSSAAALGIDPSTLGDSASERVVAMPFVPQPLLFAHGLVDVMLSHGGANTFHEAVLFGIPVLVSPGFGDQASVAQAAARLGVGVCVEAIMYPELEGAVPLERVAEEVLPEMLAPGTSRWKAKATRLAALVKTENALDAAESLLRI